MEWLLARRRTFFRFFKSDSNRTHTADTAKQDFNLTLTHYASERLPYRLSVSPHAANYLLKGALLFSLWYDQPHRPTRDSDLLWFGPDDIDTAISVFRQICRPRWNWNDLSADGKSR